MPDSLRPLNEVERLFALQSYQVRGTAPFFEEFVRVTAKLFAVPIAIISLVEAETEWRKVCEGSAEYDARAQAETMCSVAVLQEQTTIFEVWPPDLCQLVNPETVRQLNLQFYASRPLCTSTGQVVGALCIIDRQPRTLAHEEQEVLTALAAVAMRLLDLQVTLANATGPIPSLWPDLYILIAESITRLDTLTALASWEESADTTSAVEYRRSRHEEMAHVARVLHGQIGAAIERFSA
jgi:hypothetical protein